MRGLHTQPQCAMHATHQGTAGVICEASDSDGYREKPASCQYQRDVRPSCRLPQSSASTLFQLLRLQNLGNSAVSPRRPYELVGMQTPNLTALKLQK